MRSITATALLVAVFLCSTPPAMAQNTSGEPGESLSPPEQLREWQRQFGSAVATSTTTGRQPVPPAASGPGASAANKTIQTLRSQIQTMSVAFAQLQQENERLSKEVSSTIAASRKSAATYGGRIATLERERSRLRGEVATKRPLFWRDPADWAAMLSGLAIGALAGVGLAGWRRSARRASASHELAGEASVDAPAPLEASD